MVPLLATLLIAAPVQAASPPVDADVVVIGERMRRLKLALKANHRTGISRCVVKRASGDASLDARMCEAAQTCGHEAHSASEMHACMAPRLQVYIAEHAARRKAAAAADVP